VKQPRPELRSLADVGIRSVLAKLAEVEVQDRNLPQQEKINEYRNCLNHPTSRVLIPHTVLLGT
jgi:hypothetical protein